MDCLILFLNNKNRLFSVGQRKKIVLKKIKELFKQIDFCLSLIYLNRLNAEKKSEVLKESVSENVIESVSESVKIQQK
jgi:hypothetical protein